MYWYHYGSPPEARCQVRRSHPLPDPGRYSVSLPHNFIILSVIFWWPRHPLGQDPSPQAQPRVACWVSLASGRPGIILYRDTGVNHPILHVLIPRPHPHQAFNGQAGQEVVGPDRSLTDRVNGHPASRRAHAAKVKWPIRCPIIDSHRCDGQAELIAN